MDGTTPNTTWFRYISFPLFILNSIQALGNVREGAGDEVAEPGRPSSCTPRRTARTITVDLGRRPTAENVAALAPGDVRLQPGRQDRHLPGALGAQAACCRSRSTSSTPARATWPRADSSPRACPTSQAEAYKIKIGYNPVTGTRKPPRSQKDIWWYFALLVLGVLLVEWYVYNRRVYI